MTVTQFCYWLISISQFEKTPVKVLQGLVPANCHVFAVFEDSEYSPKFASFIDAAVMLALEPLEMTIYICWLWNL